LGRRPAPHARTPLPSTFLTLIRSSSTPPAVVTTTSTRRCWTSQRTTSRLPADARLEVKARKIFVPTRCRSAGSAGPGVEAGSSDRCQVS